MPRILCKCGETLRYGDIPCPIEWRFISDKDFDRFSGMVDSEEVYSATRSFLRCPSCKRLWVYWNGFSSDPTEYVVSEKENTERDRSSEPPPS